MGDSGTDTSSTAEDFIDSTEVDQPTQDQNRSNIVGSSSYDAQFTADNLEARGLPPENFMSAANFAQTRQGGAGGDDSPSVSVPSIQAASSTLAPGILGETLSDFQSGVRSDTGRRPMGFDTPANEMLEAAIGTTARIPNVSRETVVDRSGQIFPSMTTGAGLQTLAGNVAGLKGSTQNLADAINFGAGFPDEISARRVDDPRFIDFGVVDQRAPSTGVSTVGDDFAPALDMVDARTQDTSIVGDDFQPALDMVDARTTATGTFDPEAENLMDSTFLDTTPYKEGTAVADIKLRDAPFDENLNLFGLQIPNLAGRALNLGAEKLNDRLFDRIVKKPSGEVLRDKDGRIIGVMDETNSFLIEGMPGLDSKGQMRGQMQEDQGGGEQVTKAPPKAPTDPCPDGYQLIDGKCTPTGATDTGTGFIMFPADRDPAFRRGPFTPTTVATNPNIQALNPVTFGLSNIFRR